MTTVYISMGSNLRHPERQLRMAVGRLKKLSRTRLLASSKILKNPAVGRKAQPPFCNAAAVLETRLPPRAFLKKCQKIELQHKRKRKIRWGARTLDIDILLYGSLQLKSQDLLIPHPAMLYRDFVLSPLLEIAPDACLPDGQKIRTFYDRLQTNSPERNS